MPSNFFGRRIFGVGEHVFTLCHRLNIVPVVITQVNCAQVKRRGLDEPEIVITYLAEPRAIIGREFKTYGSIDANMVHPTSEEAQEFKDSVIRDRFTPSPPAQAITTPRHAIKMRKRK